MSDTSLGGTGGYDFQSTMWSLVLKAKDKREEALNQLFSIYWKPIYFYVRRKGKNVEDAKDLTQGFFIHFFESDLLDRVQKGRGRFKNYLLATLEHYLANEYRTAGDPARAALALTIATEIRPRDANALYDLACARAVQGETSKALDALGRSLEAGFSPLSHLETDPDLATLRQLPAYRELVERARTR